MQMPPNCLRRSSRQHATPVGNIVQIDVHRLIPELSQRLLRAESQGLSPLPDGRPLLGRIRSKNDLSLARHGDATLAGVTPTRADGEIAGLRTPGSAAKATCVTPRGVKSS